MKPEAGSQRLEARGWKPDAGSQRLEARGWRPKDPDLRTIAGIQKTEAG